MLVGNNIQTLKAKKRVRDMNKESIQQHMRDIRKEKHSPASGIRYTQFANMKLVQNLD